MFLFCWGHSLRYYIFCPLVPFVTIINIAVIISYLFSRKNIQKYLDIGYISTSNVNPLLFLIVYFFTINLILLQENTENLLI